MSAGTKECDCGGKTELMSDFRLAGSPELDTGTPFWKGPFRWHVVCLSCGMRFTCNLTSMYKTKDRWNRMRGEGAGQLESSLTDIDSDSLLRICLCENICIGSHTLQRFVEAGCKGLLHVEDGNGEFVKVTVDMLGDI